ncbi:MAG: multidrug effflux MFS transporter [Cyclobacteriaceae bacterium]|nr:multidrug effflux MFS transporter [Cyclobacteriaceae bacterium]
MEKSLAESNNPDLVGSKRFVTILILGLLSAIGPFSIDMYLPGFPSIAEDLNTTIDSVAYSVSSFFIGVCFGQLLCGPLLDRFGRKRPLYVGLIIYILASIGCALSTSIEALIICRFFQAIGGCVGMVAPRAIVRDVFPLNENARIFSFLILILGVSPILAPTVGSYVIQFGWSYVFIILALVTMLILTAVVFWLPESKQPDPTFSLQPRPILNSFAGVLKNQQFLIYTLSGGIASAGLFAYVAGSPFVFMKLYGVNEKQYGMIFAAIAAGLISSSQLNNIMLKKFTSEQIMRIVLILQSIIGIVLVTGTVLDVLGLYGTIFTIFLFLSCQGFSFPNSAALSMAPFSKEAGSASAIMGALQMGLGALSSAVVGLANAQSAIPLTIVMSGGALIGLLILLIGTKRMLVKPKELDVKEGCVDMIEKF